MTTHASDALAAFRTAPHLLDPSRTLAVWFTDPPGIFVQFARRAPCTVPLAQWMAGPLCTSVAKKYPGEGPLVFVLDLTHMQGRDPASRQMIVDAGRTFASRLRRTVIVPPADASRVYIASLSAAASLARLVGLTVSVESLSDAVRSLSAASSGV